MKKILFICTGNTCRSPMASTLFVKRFAKIYEHLEPQIQVESAGLFTIDNLSASAEAITVMGEAGFDISQHRSSCLRDGMVQEADLILTMTLSQRDQLTDKYPSRADYIYSLGEFIGQLHEEVIDPFGCDLDIYRRCLMQLKVMVDKLINKIIESR